MESDSRHRNLADYVNALAERGQYHFTVPQLRQALGVSAPAARNALRRLAAKNGIASPARGFYVIIPPEYRRLGCLPAEQFIPALMEREGRRYYVGLLSAAQYYGAAHHRPQEFQVFLESNRRPVECGAVRVAFFARKRLRDVPTRLFNTPRGPIAVSTPEATAIDLAGYPGRAGGLDQVAMTISELAEEIDAELLVKAAETAPLPWAQRLGYLLELGGADEAAQPLCRFVVSNARDYTLLAPGAEAPSAPRHRRWKLVINMEVEPES
ncbi:type IV toxin-antitoxin system AbiEi family antitoxin [Spiribacter halobius]|uniref:type IV toxin-antitoxin system AbiEi family antitoxin n=1 Tax=Sediminicurvatus halobius TaxID=2182432 RepID=UPI0018EEC6C7|nr:type IV toxin-antitoxin system AbiEi family antitoxin [Spiribacter halobius]UEX77424.1 type IV toxin-antitoxin system AbiEi family antitoxin [Spiribacter halobius]